MQAFGTAAEGVRIRFDPCWKNYVQLTINTKNWGFGLTSIWVQTGNRSEKRLWRQGSPWFICRRTRQQIHQGVPCLQSLFSLLLPVCTQILDSVATVLRQWEMPCGTAAEGVRIRFDPCWKNYVQLTSCTWRPFARPLRHQWKSLRAWLAIKGGCWWHYIELMSCVAGLDVYRFTEVDFSYMVVYCVCVFVVFVVCVCLLCLLSVCVIVACCVWCVCVCLCVFVCCWCGVSVLCYWCVNISVSVYKSSPYTCSYPQSHQTFPLFNCL